MRQAEVPAMKTTPNKRRGKHEEPKFPVEPVVIQVIKTPRGTMNHSYRDFSQVPPQADYEHPKEIKDMTFSQKLHHILSNPDYEKWISWMPHGRAFKVHVPVMFESQVCPKYFNHKRYSSFLRELNNYGFKHVSKGTDRNSYYHEFFLKDRPHLCQYMPPCKDARRLVADPTNEPNFYRISRKYPLDGVAPAEESTDEQPPLKRAKSDSTAVAQGVTVTPMSYSPQPTLAGLGAPAPGLLGMTQPNMTGASGLNPQTAALLSILEAQNKNKAEEQQRAMLAAALLQQQQNQVPAQPVPANNNSLTAVLGLLGQH